MKGNWWFASGLAQKTFNVFISIEQLIKSDVIWQVSDYQRTGI